MRWRCTAGVVDLVQGFRDDAGSMAEEVYRTCSSGTALQNALQTCRYFVDGKGRGTTLRFL